MIQAALAELVERGPAGVTMQQVARRAGASKETLYAWFGNREGLLTAVVEANADASVAGVAAVLDEIPADAAAARADLEAYGRGLLALLTGPASVALNRAAMVSPALAAIVLESGRHRVGPLVERYLAGLHAAGIIEAPSETAAYQTLYGLVVRDTQIRVLLGEAPPSVEEARRAAEHAVGQFMDLHEPAGA